MHPGNTPVFGRNAPPKVLTYRAFATADNAGATFPGLDAGPAAADRRCIVGITGQGLSLRTITALTIGGIAATELVTVSGNTRRVSLYIAHVPLGATVDVAATWSSSLADQQVSLWTLTGITSDAPINVQSGNADPLVATGLLTVNGGCAVAVAGSQNNTSVVWTNATERYDTIVEGGRMWAGADAVTDGSALTITATGATTGSSRGICAASF